MTDKVERGLRKQSGEKGGGEDRNRPCRGRSHGSPTTPSRKREGGTTGGDAGGKGANPFMPGLRVREDGWTEARTRTFLAVLAQSGCVTDAARVAGMSRKAVNDARRRFPEFDRACSTALARALRGLQAVAYERAVVGREMVVIRGGKEVERRIMPSDSMLGLLLKRGELGPGEGGGGAARAHYRRYDGDAVISAEEHMEGWRFDSAGIKYFHPGSATEKLLGKLERMRAAFATQRDEEEAATGLCMRCGQPAAGEAAARLAAQRAGGAGGGDAGAGDAGGGDPASD